MSQGSFILTQAQCDVLAKSFHKYDTEENGKISVMAALQLCAEVLGHELSTSELTAIKSKLESKDVDGVVSFADYMDVMAEHMANTTRWGFLKTPLQSHIGIETLPDQLKKRIMQKGFEFNIMVVGESGLGKSTLVNTIFKGQLSRQSCLPVPLQVPPTVQINSVCHLIEEEGVKLKLTLTDTPGFGDQVNNSQCWDPILQFINNQYEHYLNEEVAVVRKAVIPDTRIHCCVYFIPPSGHCLRNIDIECLKKLGNSVNIIPVIAKGDTLTLEERQAFRQRLKEDFVAHNIRVYPTNYEVEDSEEASLNSELESFIPFAVIGSEQIYSVSSC